MDVAYERLSAERKRLQALGYLPDWYTTPSYQMFLGKYEHDTGGQSLRGQYKRIARTAAQYVKHVYPEAEDRFFELLWRGWLSPSTPVLSNMGTTRGMSVSCSGTYIPDSVRGFYGSLQENACLTQEGFGTSSYGGDVRPRGSPISRGGKASGIVPVLREHISMASNITQGTARRGAWALYIEMAGGDTREALEYLRTSPDECNLAINVRDSDQALLDSGDSSHDALFKRMMYVRALTGKPFIFFPDKANRRRPQMYVDMGLEILQSNLCTEISLFNNEAYTFTCVLSSMVTNKYYEWRGTKAVFWATLFLDCVAEDFIQRATGVPGLEKAVAFTRAGRALGLGQCGLATLFQELSIPFESLEAHMLSTDITKYIQDEALKASKELARTLGEPEWCKGYGVRNTHRTAVAPTKSTALLMGGISEGINPDLAFTFTQLTSAGEVNRVNPNLIVKMKERGVYNQDTIDDITDHFGSVQHVAWLTPHEKDVFKTAFEMNQDAIVNMANARGAYLDQGQSLNLAFAANHPEELVAAVHQRAFNLPNIQSLYYMQSTDGVAVSKGECESCM